MPLYMSALCLARRMLLERGLRVLVLILGVTLLPGCQTLETQFSRARAPTKPTDARTDGAAPVIKRGPESALPNTANDEAAAAPVGRGRATAEVGEGQGDANRNGMVGDHAAVQRWLIQAVDALQNGSEHDAEALLDQVQRSEPGNSLARKLRDQIHVDPQRALGASHFAYSVQAGDTMGTLARRFLNDPYRFYVLARYNGLRVPARLAAGQVIQIPSRDAMGGPDSGFAASALPPTAASTASTPGRSLAPAVAGLQPPAPVPPAPSAPSLAALATGTPAPLLSDQALQIARSSREAELCQRQQDLDCALRKWNEVLKLDPGNPNALAKRERIALLRSKLGTGDTAK